MKEYLRLEQTDYSPSVLLNEVTLVLEGESRLENPQDFYGQIIAFFKNNTISKQENFKVIFFFEHLSSSSILFVNYLIREVIEIENVTIEWCFFEEDEEMKEVGEMLTKVNNTNFVFVEKGGN